MNQGAPNQSQDRDGICGELLTMAHRELAAFLRAVTELFGAEQAQLSAEDWLHEVESSRTLPTSRSEWRLITTKVIAQLADRYGQPVALPVDDQLHPATY